ncbi:MAG: molybdenum cofactor biosynthesis protein MoaE [Pseudomonadota bacterium]
MSVRVIDTSFDPSLELSKFGVGVNGAGAVVTFSGIVRGDGGLTAMEIEHYPAMTEKALQEIRDQAVKRFELTRALIIHRHGRLAPGETIMMVATAALHRRAAFDGADFLMDYLKSRAPFWKKELRPDGATWVEAKSDDDDALRRW